MKFLKELMPYIVIIVVVVLIRSYIITPVIVSGKSMMPTLEHRQVLLLKKYDKKISRFDIVVINHENEKLVKRVIGLPGDKIEYINNKLYINDKLEEDNYGFGYTDDFSTSTKIPDGYYLVLGDNRTNSTDSRVIGLIKKSDILGTTNFSLFPFNKIGIIK